MVGYVRRIKQDYISWTNQHRISYSVIFLPFLGKFGTKIQNRLFIINFIYRVKYHEFAGRVNFFLFRLEKPFFGQTLYKKMLV